MVKIELPPTRQRRRRGAYALQQFRELLSPIGTPRRLATSALIAFRAQPDCRQHGRLSGVRVETVDTAEYREAFGEQWQHRLVSSERAQVGRPAPAAMHFAFLSRPQLQQH